MKTSRPFTFAFIAVAALTLATAPARAVITLYHESFSGGAVALNGSTPDTTSGGNTWSSAGWLQDGTIFNRGNTTGAESGWLPFTPQSGTVYTLTATLDAVASGTVNGSWTAIGFAAGSTTSTFFAAPNNTSPWMLYRATQTPDQIVTFQGPGVSIAGVNHTPVPGPVELSIVLDTRNPDWIATWYEGANLLRSVSYTGSVPITHVGFGRSNSSNGPMSDFTLTVIPEPSAAALLGLGALAFLGRRRRQQ